MEKMKKKFYGLVIAIAIIGSAFVTSAPVSAQSNGLGVTPKISLLSKPGGSISDNLRVTNLSNTQPLNLKVTLVDFRPINESGTPQLLQDPNAPLTPWSLKPYISIPELVNIPPGQAKNVPFTIKFPPSVGAGSYYVAVEYRAQGNTDQQKVTISASSATLLFVNVQGNATELASLLDFGPYEKDHYKSFFTKSAPSNFSYRLKNGGNLNESPAGSLVIRNLSNHVVASINNVNPRGELALIGQTRRFQVCNPKDTSESQLPKENNCTPLKLTPGRYTAELVLFYGQNGQESRQIGANAAFWYLPLWFIAIVVVVLAAIVYTAYRIYRRFNKKR
jgi:hypothetical protein